MDYRDTERYYAKRNRRQFVSKNNTQYVVTSIVSTIIFGCLLVLPLILLFSLTSCGTVECVYSEATYFNHQIHLEGGMDMSDCFWCLEQHLEVE